MESKYIKGTNKQYSIRKDKIILRHYNSKKVFDKPVETVLKLSEKNTLYYPNSRYCSREKQAYYSIKSYRKKVSEGEIMSKTETTLKKRPISNPEKEKYRERRKKVIEELPRHYIAELLKIPTHQLTNELYNHYKTIVLLKRKIAKENNINIEKFN